MLPSKNTFAVLMISMAEKKGTKSLEETFQGIEEIIEKMEQPDVSLEDSFALYQQGVQELKSCNEILDQVEKKMQVLNANGTLEDFEISAD